MTIYDKLADLVETHKQEIMQQTTAGLVARHLPRLTTATIDQVEGGYHASLAVFATYLRDGDINKYREYVQQTTRQQNEQGFSLEEIIAIGDTLAANINRVIERELAGPQFVLSREKFNQRLKSLSVFGRAAAFNSSRLLK